jgi:hypothetical protein
MRPDPVGGVIVAPQSFNRYVYTLNDPVNLTDPLGLYEPCVHQAMTEYLAKKSGFSAFTSARLGEFAGDEPGGADSPEFAVNGPKFAYSAQRWAIHFPTEAQLSNMKSTFFGDIRRGLMRDLQHAGHTLHAIEDGHGAHQGYIGKTTGHASAGHTPDRIVGDQKFIDVSNEIYQFLRKSPTLKLTNAEINEMIDAIEKQCAKHRDHPKLQITRPPTGGGGGAAFGGGVPFWYYGMYDFLNWLYSIPVGRIEDDGDHFS